jgi:hypothetical protein
MVGYSFLDDSFIRNSMPVYPGANQPCRLLQCNRDLSIVMQDKRGDSQQDSLSSYRRWSQLGWTRPLVHAPGTDLVSRIPEIFGCTAVDRIWGCRVLAGAINQKP